MFFIFKHLSLVLSVRYNVMTLVVHTQAFHRFSHVHTNVFSSLQDKALRSNLGAHEDAESCHSATNGGGNFV